MWSWSIFMTSITMMGWDGNSDYPPAAGWTAVMLILSAPGMEASWHRDTLVIINTLHYYVNWGCSVPIFYSDRHWEISFKCKKRWYLNTHFNTLFFASCLRAELNVDLCLRLIRTQSSFYAAVMRLGNHIHFSYQQVREKNMGRCVWVWEVSTRLN